ncbi:protein tyrosine phosphatase [Pectinatus frisingensis]|uniref:phosphatase domain-containing putative toxin n=1 Tax=Pectinatus frisingensis TaxID=865 RepID=UPI0015F533F5|nr:protein tyrosine phosphatase [Pectinatus frisingensis]
MPRKNIISLLLIFLAILLPFPISVSAQKTPLPQIAPAQTILKIDHPDKNQLPGKFRTVKYPFITDIDPKYKQQLDAAYQPSRVGLDTLNASGSAQPSYNEFQQLASYLKQQTKNPIYIIDLRQESHGIINGDAVSWYGKHNWANIGKTRQTILKEEHSALKNTLYKTITVAKINKYDQIRSSKNEFVRQALTEKEMVQAVGFHYFRITATDHRWPAAENIDRFINFYKTLPSDVWLHFHCQAGQGRTTIFMAMFDMMRNPDIPLKDILYRQYLIGGNYSAYTINTTDSSKQWKAKYYNEKAAMIKIFYQYVQANHTNNFKTIWSVWLKNHSTV